MKQITVTKLRDQFTAFALATAEGAVEITKEGEVVAVLCSPENYGRLNGPPPAVTPGPPVKSHPPPAHDSGRAGHLRKLIYDAKSHPGWTTYSQKLPAWKSELEQIEAAGLPGKRSGPDAEDLGVTHAAG